MVDESETFEKLYVFVLVNFYGRLDTFYIEFLSRSPLVSWRVVCFYRWKLIAWLHWNFSQTLGDISQKAEQGLTLETESFVFALVVPLNVYTILL